MDAVERAATWIATAAIVTSVLPVGGMWPPAQALYAIIAVVCMLALAAVAALKNDRWRWNPIALVLFGLAAAVLVRDTWLGALFAGEHVDTAASLWGLSFRGTAAPGRVPLAALRLLGVGAVVQIGTMRFASLIPAVRAVCAMVAITFACGFVHLGFGLDQIFGVFSAVDMNGLRDPLAAPFVNDNQAGSLYALGSLLAAAIASLVPRLRPPMLIAAVGLLVFPVVFDARGPLIAALVGHFTLFTLPRLPPGDPRRYAKQLVIILGVVWAGITALVWGLGSPVVTKVQNWVDAARVLPGKPLGIGPGVWPDVAGQNLTERLNVRSQWIESAPLDMAADHGWIALLILVITAGWVLHFTLVQGRHDAIDRRPVIVSVVLFVWIDATFGMAFEATSYRYAIALLVGAAAGNAFRRKRSARVHRNTWTGTVAVLALTAWAAQGIGTSIRLGEAHAGGPLGETLRQHGAQSDALHDAVQSLAQHIPLDPVLISFAADMALARGDAQEAERFAQHLIGVAPGRHQVWRIAIASAMASANRDLACARAQESFQQGVGVVHFVSSLAIIDTDPRVWLTCVSTDGARAAIYEGLRWQDRTVEGLAVAMHTLRTSPDDVPSLGAAVEGYFALGEDALGTAAAERQLALVPDTLRTAILGARMYLRAGEAEHALTLIDGAHQYHPREPDLTLLRLRALSAIAVERRGTAAWDDADTAFRAAYSEAVIDFARQPTLEQQRLRLGGRYFLSTESWFEAENAFRTLLNRVPNDAVGLAGLERASARGGEE